MQLTAYVQSEYCNRVEMFGKEVLRTADDWTISGITMEGEDGECLEMEVTIRKVVPYHSLTDNTNFELPDTVGLF